MFSVNSHYTCPTEFAMIIVSERTVIMWSKEIESDMSICSDIKDFYAVTGFFIHLRVI